MPASLRKGVRGVQLVMKTRSRGCSHFKTVVLAGLPSPEEGREGESQNNYFRLSYLCSVDVL